MCISFEKQNFNLNNSKLLFDDNVEINIIESKYILNQNGNYFFGKMNFKINDEKKLYNFFQTRKEFRKQLKNINLVFKYNFYDSTIFIEKIELNNNINKDLESVIKKYQNKNLKKIRKIEIKKIFNDIVSVL